MKFIESSIEDLLSRLTERDSGGWIVVKHASDQVEQLQMIGDLRHDVPMQGLTINSLTRAVA